MWIAVVATLLAGIVAVNVAALQLNIRLDGLSRERDDLRADNAVLSAEIASAAGPRVAGLARSELGLQPVEPVYVQLGRPKK